MDSIKDFFETVGGHVKDRVSSPLAGPFIFSWVIVNYKALIVLFSGMKPWVKFGYISNHIWTDWEVTFWYCLGYPLLAALGYIILYPIPLRLLMNVSGWHERTTKALKIKLSGEIPVAREELLEERKSFQEEIDGLQERLDRSSKALQYLRTEKSDYEGQLRGLRNELAGREATIVELNSKVSEVELENSNLAHQVEAQKTGHRKAMSGVQEAAQTLTAELKDVKERNAVLQEKLELWGEIILHPEDKELSHASPDEVVNFINNTKHWARSNKSDGLHKASRKEKFAELMESTEKFAKMYPGTKLLSNTAPPELSAALEAVKDLPYPPKA